MSAALPLVDDFEAGLPAGQDGTVPIGFNTFADPNSTAAISTTDAAPAPSVPGHGDGNHVLKLDLNVVAWAGVTHAFENAGATAWVTQDWSAYEGISFYLYGTGDGHRPVHGCARQPQPRLDQGRRRALDLSPSRTTSPAGS